MNLYHFCYCPQTKLREGNVFTGVCLFAGGRVHPRMHPKMYHPLDAAPPPPPLQKTDGQQAAVGILLECILVI